MKKKAIALFILSVILGWGWAIARPVQPVASQPIAEITEVRGVWLTNVASSVLFIPWGVNRAIAQLADLHFNTLYPVVWNRGHTFYPSAVAQEVAGKSEDSLLKWMRGGSDVLAEMVKVSHRRGLRVIPWFEYGLIVPANSPLARQHPDWLTQSQANGQLISEQPLEMDWPKPARSHLSRLRQRLAAQWTPQQVWLNPVHPEVQQFLTDLIVEVVSRYDVDGLQLDDHFGIPVELGYDPFTVKLYQQQHGGKKPPDRPSDPGWMRWRADSITRLMEKIVRAVKAVKPEVTISLSPNSQAFSYTHYLQDWSTWVDRGLVDELVLQVYRSDPGSFQNQLSQSAVQQARRKIPVSIGILSGTLGNPVELEQIQQQVKFVRGQEFSGVSFFYWESLWGYITPESPQKRRQGFKALFPS